MARILSLANQKGGVGKTTTTINLGASMAELGKHVLLVDFDPQGALSVGLGINPMSLELTVYNLLLEREVDPHSAVIKTEVPGLEILPSNIDLSAAEITLVSEVAREQALKRALTQLRSGYDYILIDCPPSLGLAYRECADGLRRGRDPARMRVLRASWDGVAHGHRREGARQAKP